MPVEVGSWRGTEPRPFFEAVARAFVEQLRDEDFEIWQGLWEPDRALAAYDGERIVGTAAIISFDLTVPGATLPCAGVSAVGVQATHRRRGILRRMMRAQLDAVHERGEPLAALWASEGNIYQRFGYGLATLMGRVAIDRDRSQFRFPFQPAGSVRFVEADEGRTLFPPVFEAARPSRPGFFSRSDGFWKEFFHDPEHWRRGAGPRWYLLHDTDGRADGYATYRVRNEWDDRGPKSQLKVGELMATTPSAHLELWRFLLDVDLMGRIDGTNVAPDEPLLLTVAEPRRVGLSVGDGLWLRIVDVAASLAGRTYRSGGRVVFELTDEFCPWNAGRWALTVADGTGVVERSELAADLALDTTDLAAAYLGAFSFAQLAAADRISELQPGGLDRADALFRVDRAPWCPMEF